MIKSKRPSKGGRNIETIETEIRHPDMSATNPISNANAIEYMIVAIKNDHKWYLKN